MDKQTKTGEGRPQSELWMVPAKGFNGPVMQMAAWPVELWLRWQADVLKAAVPMLTEWMARRREGADSALEALERLCACDNPVDAASIQNEWAREEVKRLESDLRTLTDSTLFWQQASAKAGSSALQGRAS